jgi:hypothetical protein
MLQKNMKRFFITEFYKREKATILKRFIRCRHNANLQASWQ